jgi:hypothetical protein
LATCPDAFETNNTALAHRFSSRIREPQSTGVGVTISIEGVQHIMSKFLIALLFVATTFSLALAQEPSQNPNNPPSQGVAPKVENGIGRADVRVFDENRNPIRNAYVKLESARTDGFFCESWNDTDERGIAVLPPIHMGNLKLKVKAKGFQKQELEVPAVQLGDPVRVTLRKK